jgi:hypothetical protein
MLPLICIQDALFQLDHTLTVFLETVYSHVHVAPVEFMQLEHVILVSDYASLDSSVWTAADYNRPRLTGQTLK